MRSLNRWPFGSTQQTICGHNGFDSDIWMRALHQKTLAFVRIAVTYRPLTRDSPLHWWSGGTKRTNNSKDKYLENYSFNWLVISLSQFCFVKNWSQTNKIFSFDESHEKSEKRVIFIHKKSGKMHKIVANSEWKDILRLSKALVMNFKLRLRHTNS